MSDPYGLPEEDLRRLISSRNNLNTNIQEPLCLYGVNGAASSFPPPNSCYDPNPNPIMVGDVFFPRGFTHYDYSSSVVNNPTTYSTATTVAAATTATFCGIETAEKGSWLGFDSAGNNRWPRQETLSLLEIRSRLDSKFRENNQKAPLWNEISRIMAEEFGYQRSGKKCKEKFENLYKYYKKTKEGKGSRQDGKHYRFFRQLEAICGDQASTQHTSTSDHKNKTPHAASNTVGTQTQTPGFTINQEDNIGDHHFNNLKSSESLSFSNNSSEFETSSSENNDENLSAIAHMMNKQKGLLDLDQRQGHDRRVRKSWRAKVEEIVDSHMRKIIETQDAWMERMLSVVEQRENKEEERMKRKESMRFDQEVHELWAKEKAWVEARDAAMIEVVRKHIGNEIELEALLPPNYKNLHCEGHVDHGSSSRWTEMEISNLIQLRTGFDQQRVRENVYLDNENGVWDEIAEKMVYMGFDRNASECKRIWDEISISLRRTVECGEVKARPWCLGLKLTDDG